MPREQLLERIREVARHSSPLSLKHFSAVTGISRRHLAKVFDSWEAACDEAGVKPAPWGKANLRRNPPINRDQCLTEIRRIANMLGTHSLSVSAFEEHGTISMQPVRRHFRSWTEAVKQAGLLPLQRRSETPLAELATDFRLAVEQLRRIPTLRELLRRSRHGERCFTTKFGCYDEFKRRTIQWLTSNAMGKDDGLVAIMDDELRRITAEPTAPHAVITEHLHGRTLGFRAFAYAPTYENDVVALFSAVADELGFEIICTRPAFPDCEAQRRLPGSRQRFKKCLIEFELRSSDFVKHGHPQNGCDLIVCWEHDWPECPVEVLDLRTAIRSLPGWR